MELSKKKSSDPPSMGINDTIIYSELDGTTI